MTARFFPSICPSIPVLLLMLLPLALLSSACGEPSDRPSPGVSSQPPPVSGMYQVEGTTTEVESGNSRPIRGSIILSQKGDSYSASFHLKTSYPGPDGNVDAEVIGTGEGRVEGDRLLGSAETQILPAAAPGVDTKFPFVAQLYGPRLVSESVATLKQDGSIVIEIENRGAEGEQYAPTRTRVSGQRATPRGATDPASLPPEQ
jgi:hypothetical protein